MSCDPSSGQCVYVTVWSGNLQDAVNNRDQINADNFATGDFGQLTLDFSAIVSAIPQPVVDAINAAAGAISGFLGAAANGAALVISFVSTSPTLAVILAAIGLLLIGLGYVLSQINVLVGKSVPSTSPSGIICSIGSTLGIDCGTAQLVAWGAGLLVAYTWLFGSPGSRRRRR